MYGLHKSTNTISEKYQSTNPMNYELTILDHGKIFKHTVLFHYLQRLLKILIDFIQIHVQGFEILCH